MAITVTVPPSTTKLTALADLKAIPGIAASANDTLLGSIIQRGSDAVARFQSECLMASSRRGPPAKKRQGLGSRRRRLKMPPAEGVAPPLSEPLPRSPSIGWTHPGLAKTAAVRLLPRPHLD